MTINQVVSGAAAVTSVSGTFTASSPGVGGTFTVLNASGYPSSGRFVVQLNRGLPDEEKVLISSRSGTTFTVETRGYDGTTAQSHTNPTCNLILPATVVNALIDHVDGNESDPHSTKLLNNTRHDTTSRHPLGTVVPTSASTPASITPDAAGSAGSANAVARSDHSHPISTDPAGTITPDDTAAEGTAATFARSDHRHAITAAVAGAIAPDDSAAEGTATSFARSDHRHSIVAAAAAALTETATSSEGAATSFARSDHVHATSALAWGVVATTGNLTTSSGALAGDTTITDMSLNNVALKAGRLYRFEVYSPMDLNGNSAIWSVWLRRDGSNYCRLTQHRTNSVGDERFKRLEATRTYVPASDETSSWTIFADEETGTATFTMSGAADDEFRNMTIYDCGVAP